MNQSLSPARLLRALRRERSVRTLRNLNGPLLQALAVCGEYHADVATEVTYRGHSGALYRRDYGTLFVELFPELQLRDQGFLGPRHRMGRHHLVAVREARPVSHRRCRPRS